MPSAIAAALRPETPAPMTTTVAAYTPEAMAWRDEVVAHNGEGILGFGRGKLLADPRCFLYRVEFEPAVHLANDRFNVHAGDALERGGQAVHVFRIILRQVNREVVCDGLTQVEIGTIVDMPEMKMGITNG